MLDAKSNFPSLPIISSSVHSVFTMKRGVRTDEKENIEGENYEILYEVAGKIPHEERERRVQAAFNMLFELIDKQCTKRGLSSNPKDHSRDKSF